MQAADRVSLFLSQGQRNSVVPNETKPASSCGPARALIPACLGALVLAACGGGGGDSSGPPPTSPPPPPPPNTAPTISSTEITYTGELLADGVTYLNAGDTVAVELTFSESIANSATVQFLDGTTSLGGAITATRNSANTEHTATYTVVAGNTVASGSLKYDVTNESELTDSAGTALADRAAADISNTAIDTTAPTVASIAGPGSVQLGAFEVTITFSEDVTGFDSAEDLLVTGGTAEGPAADSGSKTRYAATVTPAASAARVTVRVPTAAAADLAGNDSTASADGDTFSVSVGSEPVWEVIRPGGDTRCADGSDFHFYVRENDPARLLFFLQGGGACWSRSTCDPNSSSYINNLDDFDSIDDLRTQGIFDFGRAQNPFRNHSVVFVPYCTGDVHLGDNDRDYPGTGGSSLTIYHRGFANGTAAVEHAAETFDALESIFVSGSSAGAIPSPYYAVKLAERYPDVAVAQLGDGAGGYGRSQTQGDNWGTVQYLTQTPAFSHLTSATFDFQQLYIAAGKAYPEFRLARYDAEEDGTQRLFLSLAGLPVSSLRPSLDANNAEIRAEVTDFRAFIDCGTSHTILAYPRFYTASVCATNFRDWVANHAERKSIQDRSCGNCQ